MKIIFLGTPDFAVPSLESIYRSKHEIVLVVTQPDRARNRGVVTPCPVKARALELGLEVASFDRIRDNVEYLSRYEADCMVTCAYGQILSTDILDMTRVGVLNVHGSLLPKYRGSSPIQWCLINGERETGVTIMRTSLGVDSGDIFISRSIPISDNDNAETLMERLSYVGADLILEALDMIDRGEGVYTPQDESLATHYPMLTKDMGRVNWHHTSEELINLYRGLSPWPGLYSTLEGVTYKLFDLERVSGEGEPGEDTAIGGRIVLFPFGQLSLKGEEVEPGFGGLGRFAGAIHVGKGQELFTVGRDYLLAEPFETEATRGKRG